MYRYCILYFLGLYLFLFRWYGLCTVRGRVGEEMSWLTAGRSTLQRLGSQHTKPTKYKGIIRRQKIDIFYFTGSAAFTILSI